jgi:hypothetical protein
MRFGLVIGFVEHLQIVSTRNCSDVTNARTLRLTTANAVSFTFSGNGSQQCRVLSSDAHVLTRWQLSCNSSWSQLFMTATGPVVLLVSLCRPTGGNRKHCSQQFCCCNRICCCGKELSHAVYRPLACSGQFLQATLFWISDIIS